MPREARLAAFLGAGHVGEAYDGFEQGQAPGAVAVVEGGEAVFVVGNSLRLRRFKAA
ncbi:hypothetical protein AB0O76_37390 [Streptomyces sp. NPDC086554]|uniref:hypothetical protein n=1 Tax=Streptomyces sp. NPDC086554 TaxID=3154864 RepID=UPI003434BC7C